MQAKRSTRQLINEATLELLQERDLQHVSVRDIAKCAGVTTRSFYNHFIDKYEVVEKIYTDHMTPYFNSSLTTWTELRSAFVMENRQFFRHTYFYSGANSLLDAMAALELQKYQLHFDPAIKQNAILSFEIHQGLVFFINGQSGMLKDYLNGHSSFNSLEEDKANYSNLWDFMKQWMPSIVLDHLHDEPQIPILAAPFDSSGNK